MAARGRGPRREQRERVDVPVRIGRDANAEVDVRHVVLGVPLGPIDPTVAPSRTASPFFTAIEPRWTSVTA